MKKVHLQLRREREKQARIQAILEAGLKIFGSQGYHGTSMDAIAEAAELGKATLYYYFKSKDELLLAILQHGILDFFERLDAAWENVSDPLQKLEAVPNVGAEFFALHPDYFKLYHYLTAHPVLREKAFQKLHPLIVEKVRLIQSLFQEAMEHGLIEVFDPNDLTEIFGSLIMGMGLFTHPPVQSSVLKQKAKLIATIFMNGIRKK